LLCDGSLSQGHPRLPLPKCHNSATPAPGHAVVEAGKSIFIQYDVDHDELGQEWPVEHKGPIKDMLAPCGDAGCEAVDKESLEFFTIAAAGMINDDDVSEGGHWPTDILRDQGNGWLVVVPESVAPGFYVLRHEIIALHNAPDEDGGAQNYPFCFNLEVTGSGTETPKGAKPTTFYKTSDPGIDISIWDRIDKYVIPGPAVVKGFAPVVQSVVVATGEGEIRTGSERVQKGTPTQAPEGEEDEAPKTTAAATTTTAPKTTKTAEPEQTPAPEEEDEEDNEEEDNEEEDNEEEDNEEEDNEEEDNEEEESGDEEDNGNWGNDDEEGNDAPTPTRRRRPHRTHAPDIVFVTVTVTAGGRAASAAAPTAVYAAGDEGGDCDKNTAKTRNARWRARA
jgi:hypothetical protein